MYRLINLPPFESQYDYWLFGHSDSDISFPKDRRREDWILIRNHHITKKSEYLRSYHKNTPHDWRKHSKNTSTEIIHYFTVINSWTIYYCNGYLFNIDEYNIV